MDLQKSSKNLLASQNLQDSNKLFLKRISHIFPSFQKEYNTLCEKINENNKIHSDIFTKLHLVFQQLETLTNEIEDINTIITGEKNYTLTKLVRHATLWTVLEL